MKKLFALTISLLLIINLAKAQAPQGFKYQASIRDNNGVALLNKLVAIKISLLAGTSNGTTVYSEVHNVVTTDFGIINLNIGSGIVDFGNFNSIDWGSNTYFIKTEVDVNNGTNFLFIGTSQLLSVPYAMFAAKSGNAANDKDQDSTNELQTINLNGNNLQLNKNGGSVDLTKYDKDSQQLVLTGNTLSITKGNSIVLSGAVDLDADPANEIQNLSLSKDTLKLSKANFIVLPKDNDADSTNEIQSLNVNQNLLSLTKSNQVNIDADTTNEIQSLTYRNDSLFISKSNFVKFTQDNDRDSLNELQTISRSNDTLFLSKGNFTVLPKVNAVPSGSIITLENYDLTLLNNGYSYLGRSIIPYQNKISDFSSWQWNITFTSNSNSPGGMYDHFAVWTGSDMVVIGNVYSGKFNLGTQTWSNISKAPISGNNVYTKGIWTGNEVIAYDSYLNKVFKYNTISNIWTIIDSSNIYTGRNEYSAIWTGTDMIIWGGANNSFSGQKFNLSTKNWSSISTINSPPNKRGHSAVWTGTEMLVWGGLLGNYNNNNSDSTIYKYNPITNIWSQVVGINSPKGLYKHIAVWTGTDMLVFGGLESNSGNILNKAYRYNLSSNTWFEIPENSTAPSPRFGSSAIYTGNELMIWGGSNGNGVYFTECHTMKLGSPTYGNTVSSYLHLFKKN